MSYIHNTITRADGTPQQRAKVVIGLSWDSSVSPVPRDPTEDVTIQGPDTEYTDDNGYWSTSVTSNEVILPADSVYKITETVDETSRTYYVSVPDAATPVFWIGDIIATKPDWEEE